MNCKTANSRTSYRLNPLLRNEMSSCTAPSPSISLDALPSCRRPLGRARNVAASFGIPRVRYGRIASSAYADDGRGWSWGKRDGNGSEEEVGGGDEGLDAGNRKVQCDVEVVSWRERRIRAQIWVDADVKSVWDALTDYERLSDFIPNLVFSGRIPCPYPGRIWLEQRGLQRALYWHIEARVVLDLQEVTMSAKERELCFSMVDGDFKKFEGKWSLKAGPRSSSTLSYEVNVIPRFNFPAILLERIIRSDLPVNLQALAIRAEKRSEGTQKLILTVNSVGRIPNCDHSSISNKLDGSLSSDNELSEGELKDSIASINAAHSPPTTTAINSKWGMFGKVCRLDHPCMVDEVHLRRLDGLSEDGGVHRCVVASITVKAPVHEVWNVLTAYESLPEIVPNLAISKVLSRENNRVRILQEGCKGLLYMVLHACVILDLREHLEREISFEQVEGDFDSFQGKWIFEQLGNQHTLLKYTVESKMHKDSLLSEAIMEEVIYEDLPSNLCAIRDYIENKDGGTTVFETTTETEHIVNDIGPHPSGIATEDYAECGPRSSSTRRPRVPGLQRDIEILKSELMKFISEHGQEGFMPMRKQLRLHGRVDIDKAITRMGGFRRIASLMNLSLSYKHRKPKGYWDNLEHLEEEIRRFQRSWGMDPSYMPSRKSFERAGRYDIARALEKWGGLHEVSRLLSLKLRHPNRQAALARDKRADSVTTTDSEKLEVPRPEPYVSQDTQKWLSQLKHLDINWVE